MPLYRSSVDEQCQDILSYTYLQCQVLIRTYSGRIVIASIVLFRCVTVGPGRLRPVWWITSLRKRPSALSAMELVRSKRERQVHRQNTSWRHRRRIDQLPTSSIVSTVRHGIVLQLHQFASRAAVHVVHRCHVICCSFRLAFVYVRKWSIMC